MLLLNHEEVNKYFGRIYMKNIHTRKNLEFGVAKYEQLNTHNKKAQVSSYSLTVVIRATY